LAGRPLPIIALTASATTDEQDRCRAAGMDDFLAKPVGFDSLTAVLSRWIPDDE
jgi:CheY-like chemotaxis protein